MINRGVSGVIGLVLGVMLLVGCATTDSQQAAEWDGLVRQPHPRLSAVFVRPGAQEDMAAFRSVTLQPVYVSFASDFETGHRSGSAQRRLNADDLAAIRQSLAELFDQILREELAGGDYQIVEQPGPDTLKVSAAIVDLFITAPDAAQATGRSRTYTANSGRMTLVVELRDSVTGEILARAVDTQSGRATGLWSISNRVTNTADARRALRVWARALREGLDELYARSN
jgi:hypothetical protein